MQQLLKTSKQPEKTIKGAPAVMEGFDNMMRRSFQEEARRLHSVQPTTSPYIITEDYRSNYDSIFRKDAKE